MFTFCPLGQSILIVISNLIQFGHLVSPTSMLILLALSSHQPSPSCQLISASSLILVFPLVRSSHQPCPSYQVIHLGHFVSTSVSLVCLFRSSHQFIHPGHPISLVHFGHLVSLSISTSPIHLGHHVQPIFFFYHPKCNILIFDFPMTGDPMMSG